VFLGVLHQDELGEHLWLQLVPLYTDPIFR
jgi:hypothetical protein